ncbi:MAG: thioesterase [Leptolyngbyaceae cyanobacterium CSU_1_4]|nr:thioesterase [Leptolyngbyaceae cyanobacterium CSU_1_4]
MNPKQNLWITNPHPHPQAKARLFCLPYAGGGTHSFRRWSEHLPHLEVCPIQLPGRERRLSEAPFTSLKQLIQALTEAILPFLDRPFALFGHSMGGLIAFELTRFLRQNHHPQPLHLFVSGCRAPQLSSPLSHLHTLADAEFLQELRRYNGTPEAVLTNTELMQVLLPTLRADFAMVETYAYQLESPLDCPITAYGGLKDLDITPQDLADWQIQTVNSFAKYLLPGDHFFLHSTQSLLLQNLTFKLKTLN